MSPYHAPIGQRLPPPRVFKLEGKENPRVTRMSTVLSALSLALLAGCGGGSSTPPAATADRFAPVTAELQASVFPDLAMVIGNADGVVWRYSQGNFPADSTHLVASASKWLTSATLMRLVEQGVMRLDDAPQDYLGYWTRDPADSRSRITLAQLLAFTAGFDLGPTDGSCVGDGNTTLDACVRELYDRGLAYEPGTSFYYGPAHMQVAARMAEIASGQDFVTLFRLQVADPLGLSAATAFVSPSQSNPRASGGAASTADDYAEFLRALLAGEVVSDIETFRADRTAPPVVIVSRPGAAETNAIDWHYAFGAWREDPAVERLSSPGAFGWYPWIDFDRGYFALIAVERLPLFGFSPAEESVQLGERVRPLIETALAP